MTSPSRTGLAAAKGKQGGSRLSNGSTTIANGGGIKRSSGLIYLPRNQATAAKSPEPSIKKAINGTSDNKSSLSTSPSPAAHHEPNKVQSSSHWCPLADGFAFDSSCPVPSLGVFKHQGQDMAKSWTFDECADEVLYGKGKSSLPVFEELCRE